MKMKKKRLLQPLSFFGIILAICMMTIGYSAFNANLTISGEALVKVDNNIQIVDLNVSSLENGAYELYNSNYGVKVIDYHVALPNANSSITYKIDIKNKTLRDYGIALVSGLPDNLSYEFTNYTLGDKLCTNADCNNGEVDEVYLKIKYKTDGYDSTNIEFSGRMNIGFEYFYDVIYKNVAGSSSLKQKVLKGFTYQEIIPIPVDYKMKVRMNGLLLVKDSNYTYDENTNKLTIPNVTSNIVISIEEIGMEFDLTGTGGGAPFSYLNTGYDVNEMTFYLEIDLSSIDLNSALENIISIGNRINSWEVGQGKPIGANLHVYYPMTANTTGITIDLTYTSDVLNDNNSYIVGYGKFQKTLSLPNSNLLRLAFNSNGLYINGEKIFDETGRGNNVSSTAPNPIAFLATYFDIWKRSTWEVDIGSTEGTSRSNATYHEIKIYNNLLTVQELKDVTAISNEEIPIEEDIPYNSVSTVMIGSNPSSTIIYPFLPNDNKFTFISPTFTDLSTNSLYFEMDVSNLKQGANLENLISVGNDLPTWFGVNSYNFHVFYPDTENQDKIILAILDGSNLYSQFRGSVSLIDGGIIKIVLSANGIYVNGEKWLGPVGYIKDGVTIFGNKGAVDSVLSTFFDKFTNPDTGMTLMYGSQQGDNRSSATYNDIRVYDGVLTESQSSALTS